MTGAAADPATRGYRLLAALNWLCHGMLAVGLVMPCMTFVTRMGGATELARAAGLIHEPQTYSVLSGIMTLFENGDIVIALVLLIFSVVFPILKLIVVRLALQPRTREALPSRLLGAVALLSKYSMTDVFVIALLIVASKTMPGGSRIELQLGTFAFAAAALLSMALTSASRKALPKTGF